MYHKDLREHLKSLENNGKLVIIENPINKDTQLHPLVRLQFRGLPEEQRKAFLFKNVFDNRGKRYNISVAVCALAGSSDIYAIGMMCPRERIPEKLAYAEMHPIEPILVDRGSVQEEIHKGDNLLEHGGLDEFPVPISTPGFDCAPYFTSASWVTKDPDTGVRNVGVYRNQIKSPTRTGVHFGNVSRGGLLHWHKCKERGIPLEVAVVIGGPPSVSYVGVSKLPLGVDEFTVAGGIAGEALELVKCQTVNLEVPAYAEIVVEGELMTDGLEVEAPFGEAVGYIGMTEMMPYLNVKCITHRKDPIWLSFLSQFPPSESSKIRQHANEGALYKYLRYDQNMPHVLATAFHESVGSEALVAIKVGKTNQNEVWRTLEATAKHFLSAKTIIAVDEDIDLCDADNINWAIGSRMQPHRDCRIVKYRTPNLLDLSIMPLDELIKIRHSEHDSKLEWPEASHLLVNATLKWNYPPVSLPKREYMEEALKIWQKEGLPPLKLRGPWFGYNLGYWNEETETWARRAVNGQYYVTGEERKQKRQKI